MRVDSGIRAGTEVGTGYDPLLAKVIAHGEDRAAALRRLDRALGELVRARDVATNAAWTRALLARADVRAGEQDTGLLERVLDELPTEPPPDLLAGRRGRRLPGRHRRAVGRARALAAGVRARRGARRGDE